MILKQHHFLTPERPREEDYTNDCTECGGFLQDGETCVYCDAGIQLNIQSFQKDTAEWESLYGEEPVFNYGPADFAQSVEAARIHQRWKDHQVKFQNFKKHVYKSTITEFSKTIEDKTIAVCFWADTGETVVSIINDQNEIIFEMSALEIHSEEFEMVLKNRNIKL